MTDATDTGGLTAGGLHRTKPFDAGRLERECRQMFPGQPPGLPSKNGWQSAAEHGATPGWALRTANTTADEAIADQYAAFSVWRLLLLAVQVPVADIDGLLAAGWDLAELSHLMDMNRYKPFAAGGFSETAKQLGALHQVAPGIGGPDGTLLWHALAAVLLADSAGLTDLQTLRWLQVVLVVPDRLACAERLVLAFHTADGSAAVLQEWVPIAGPDGWAWAGAGYTPDETWRLLALPNGHPDRPGPDQLAVMAALRQG